MTEHAQAVSGPAIPQDVYNALLRNAKGWILTNFFGGTKRLEAWNAHYSHLVGIRSYYLEGESAKNLRRLAALAKAGVLVEEPRRGNSGTRTFKLASPQLEELGAQAIREWEAVGYVVGQTMPEIKP